MKRRRIAGVDLIEIEGDPSAPYIMIFHGYGADCTDLVSLNNAYLGKPRPTWIFPEASLQVPIGPGFFGKAWFPIDFEKIQVNLEERNFDQISKNFSPELTQIRLQIETLISEMQIPISKLILGGFSQGAVLAIDIALHAKEQVKALLIFSGIAIDQENWKQLIPLHCGLPFFQSHGEFDPLLPIECAITLEELLVNGGLQGKLRHFQGGHGIPHEILIDLNNFLESLLQQ